MEFQHIKAKDLHALAVQLAESGSDPLPISPWRAKSQEANPAVQPDDILLVTARDKKETLLGYIGILPLKSSLLGGENIFWNTCWWVAKDAGAAVSMTLLSHFFKLTSQRVAFSDLSEHTVKILGSLGAYTVQERSGGIYRFRSAYHVRAFGKKSFFLKMLRSTGMLQVIDRLLNIRNAGILRNRYSIEEDLSITWKDEFDENHRLFIRDNNQHGWITPDASLYDWWNGFPWLIVPARDMNKVSMRYYFSTVAHKFRIRILEARKDDRLLGLAICSIRDGVLKTNFMYSAEGNKDVLPPAILKAVLTDRSIHSVISFNETFVSYMKRVGTKPAVDKVRYTACANQLLEELKSEPVFQDGDGDYVFT